MASPTIRFCASASCLVLSIAVFSSVTMSAAAQTTSSMPVATSEPASSLQSMPAAATAKQVPVSMPAYDPGFDSNHIDSLGSTYIPVDSTIYPMAMRLYSLGYLDTAFVDMRPWTRRSLQHMLNASASAIMQDNNDEAVELLASLQTAITDEAPGLGLQRGRVYGIETGYTRFMGISGQTLRDSYHLGQTIANDYGRPYEPGFNNITGFSSVNEWGRFSLYVRGEYQYSPSGSGYSLALTNLLSTIDEVPYSGFNLHQATIPSDPVAKQSAFSLQEAVVSYHLLGHEISGGKSDYWVGPGMGGGMAWSNNAPDIYSFRINRVEPLYIPLLSKVLGTFRYDFFVGSLKGHTDPNDPWVHSETVTVAPTPNVRIAFQRTVIWGGKDHEPITLHTFLRSFFNLDDTTGATKLSREDPGARFSSFNFSWRLPLLTRSVTLYADSIVHDDVTPPSAPRRSAYRPGVYLSHVPGVPKLDFRVEAVSTDTSTLRSLDGQFNYYEIIQRQGYTNKGFIMGDWVGREAKGGQAWLTYHLSANEWVQLEYLNKKTPKDFIPGGTTQNQFKIDVVKRFRKEKDIELNAWLQYEGWKAPVYIPGNSLNKNTTIAFQATWYPKLHTAPVATSAPVLKMR
jgi:hypothetical protein